MGQDQIAVGSAIPTDAQIGEPTSPTLQVGAAIPSDAQIGNTPDANGYIMVNGQKVKPADSGNNVETGISEGSQDLLNIPNGITHMLFHPIDTLKADAAARVAASHRIGQDWQVDKPRALSDMIDAMVPFLGPADQAYLREKNEEGKPTAAAVRGYLNVLPMFVDPQMIGGKIPGFEEAEQLRKGMESVKAAGRGNKVASALTDVQNDTGVKMPLSNGIRNGGLHALSELIQKRAANIRGEQVPNDLLLNQALQEAGGQLAKKLSNTSNPADWADAISEVRNNLGAGVRHVEDGIRARNLTVPVDDLQAVQARANELANQLEKPGSDYNLPNLPGGARARALKILRQFAQPNKLVSNIDQTGRPIQQFSNPVSVPKIMRVNDMLDKLDQLQELTGPVTDSVADGALMQLKGALSKAIRQTIGPQQSAAWDTANQNYATLMGQLRKTIAGNVLKTGKPSQIAETLLGKNASALENVTGLQQALGPKFPQVQRAIWERLVERNTDSNGILNAQSLAKDWDRLGPKKQQAWFGDLTPKLNRFVHATRVSGVQSLEPLGGPAGASPSAGAVDQVVNGAHSIFQVGRGLTLELANHATAKLSPKMVSAILNTHQGAQIFGNYMRAAAGSAARRGFANQLLYLSQKMDKQVQ